METVLRFDRPIITIALAVAGALAAASMPVGAQTPEVVAQAGAIGETVVDKKPV